ncbi:PHD finger protein 7-like [Grus japonensis]|uniref:PHD finger protein 7-like n=1 Tax=Grus japonensis TaxID=30415 RepID=A0ABC9XSC3_GRUJA
MCTAFAMKQQDPDSREQGESERCFVCGETGAAITCQQKGCNRSFHLPCASEGECVTQFFGLYRSFCWEHRPEQAVQAAPEQNTTCIICLGLVEDKKSYHTMVCPACQHAWFHRTCIQKQAIHAGVCFRCLRCQSKDQFVMEMLTMGIRISKRFVFLFPTHKTSGASVVPGQGRPGRLLSPDSLSSAAWRSWQQGVGRRAGTAWICLMLGQPGLKTFPSFSSRQPSRESDQAFGLVYQRHVRCNASKCLCLGGREQAEEEGSWQMLLCSSCAAKGIHRRCSYLRNSATTWQCDCCAGLGPGASDKSELASIRTASQVASGLSHGSLVPESSRPSTITYTPPGPSRSSPGPESSSRSSHLGPDRIRHRSHLQHRAQKPYSRPGKPRGTSHVPAPSVEPSSPSTAWQMALGLFLGLLALQRSSSTSASQAASGLSRGALVLESSSRSSHPGPDRIRHRSRLQHRAQKPYSRPGRCC